jgi:hypothetical protein
VAGGRPARGLDRALGDAVELAGPDDSAIRGILEGRASPTDPSALDTPVERALGGLVADGRQTRHDPEAGEPA